MGKDNQPDGITQAVAVMASKRKEKVEQDGGRFCKFFSMVIRLYYWLKLFTEGQGLKDKLILLPGAIFRPLGSALGTALVLDSSKARSKIPSLYTVYRRIAKPNFDVTVENRDGKFFCRKRTEDVEVVAEACEYPLRGYFEGITQGIFVDVGSNIGKYTIKVARQLENKGSVISVEPEISNFEILKTNVELNDLSNVMLCNVACWNKNEKLKLHLARSPSAHSVKKPVSTDFVEVSGLKLDDILKDLRIDHVDFIKIDAEGADGEVLEGAEETLARNPHLKIIFEAADRDNLTKCREVLGKHGFTTVPIVNIKDYYYARKALAGQVVKCDDEKN